MYDFDSPACHYERSRTWEQGGQATNLFGVI